MLEWYRDMYMDNIVTQNPEKYKMLVSDNRPCIPAVYCIITAFNEGDQLEIMSCNELLFRHCRRKDMFVVGLAASYRNAIDLVQKIIMDVYGSAGDFDIKAYISARK